MKKILIISTKIPNDNEDGGSISQYVFTDYIRNYYLIHYVFINNTSNNKFKIDYLKLKWENVSFCFIPKDNDIVKTTNPILKYAVIFFEYIIKILNRILKKIEPNSSEIKVKKRYFYPNYNKFLSENEFNSINLEILKFKPDIVQVENPPLMNLANFINNKIPKIYVHHEIQFARFESSVNNKNDYYLHAFNLIKSLELNYLNAYDYVFTFSEIDKAKLESDIDNKVKVLNSPFPVLDCAFDKIEYNEFSIKKVVFVGSQNHDPNIDAILWYIEEMGQTIMNDLNLKLYITGNWDNEFKKKYKNLNFIEFVGFVDDLKDFCRNSILVVPVRIGSGVRTKILYAMAQGIPVISAKIGREGILSESIIEANTTEEFIDAIKLIYSNLDFAYKISKEGQAFIRENYSQKKLCDQRIEYYENIFSNNSL